MAPMQRAARSARCRLQPGCGRACCIRQRVAAPRGATTQAAAALQARPPAPRARLPLRRTGPGGRGPGRARPSARRRGRRWRRRGAWPLPSCAADARARLATQCQGPAASRSCRASLKADVCAPPRRPPRRPLPPPCADRTGSPGVARPTRRCLGQWHPPLALCQAISPSTLRAERPGAALAAGKGGSAVRPWQRVGAGRTQVAARARPRAGRSRRGRRLHERRRGAGGGRRRGPRRAAGEDAERVRKREGRGHVRACARPRSLRDHARCQGAVRAGRRVERRGVCQCGCGSEQGSRHMRMGCSASCMHGRACTWRPASAIAGAAPARPCRPRVGGHGRPCARRALAQPQIAPARRACRPQSAPRGQAVAQASSYNW